MKEINYTLITDGSSDRNALTPMIQWLLNEYQVPGSINGKWADLRNRPQKGFAQRIKYSLELYPCNLLFIHRDAEKEPLERRKQEIESALAHIEGAPPAVAVIPVRMHEAWLLFDEQAIRLAAGNSRGTTPLDLPRLKTLENHPDPKQVLQSALKTASGLKGRRLKKLAVGFCATRVAELIEDFSPLRQLSAFNLFEKELGKTLADHGFL